MSLCRTGCSLRLSHLIVTPEAELNQLMADNPPGTDSYKSLRVQQRVETLSRMIAGSDISIHSLKSLVERGHDLAGGLLRSRPGRTGDPHRGPNRQARQSQGVTVALLRKEPVMAGVAVNIPGTAGIVAAKRSMAACSRLGCGVGFPPGSVGGADVQYR